MHPAPTPGPREDQPAAVLALVASATQRLLGDTIAVAEQDWRGPSRLPGWTRGHVATHLARQADGLVRLATGALAGERVALYASAEQRDADIEEGAARGPLDLQVDLDTSAQRLTVAFDEVTAACGWDTVVELRGVSAPTRMLPLARLSEVVLHHVDLDTGFSLAEVDPEAAESLLQWCALRLRARDDFPRLRLVTGSGLEIPVGSSGGTTTVEGGASELLGWLTGRSEGRSLTGRDGLTLPSFG